MTSVEQLQKSFFEKAATVAGKYLFKCLCGFAKILEDKSQEPDIDAVDIYMILGMKNGTTLQLTGQITDINIDELNNTVILHLTDRKAYVMPDSTFIFSLNEIATIQSLDVVTHQKRMEARMEQEAAAEVARQEAAKQELAKAGNANNNPAGKEPVEA